jgi:nucleoid-associated protein YgaU
VRILLGALILVAVFLAATTWQRRFADAARAEREVALGRATAEEAPPEGWSLVTVGRPSLGEGFGIAPGAVPPAVPAASNASIQPPGQVPAHDSGTATPGGTTTSNPPASTPSAVDPTSATQWIVEPGQSLSRICAARYGSARLEIVEAVARHNGLASADLVREGQRLELPPVERLLPKR